MISFFFAKIDKVKKLRKKYYENKESKNN